MKPASAHAKGRKLENEIKDDLRSSGIDLEAYRVAGSGGGSDKGDVVAPSVNWMFEAKNVKKSSPLEWMRQMEREALTKLGGHGAVVWSPPHTPFQDSLVILRWYEFRDLLKKAKEPALDGDTQQAKWELSQLIQSAKKVLKRLEK